MARDRGELVATLVSIARAEREAAGGAPPPERHVRLRRLERPRPPLHQAAPVVPEPVMRLDADLTPRQRVLLQALHAAPSVSAAATDLGVSRSSVYASLRRVARTVGVADVPELLSLVRAGRLDPTPPG